MLHDVSNSSRSQNPGSRERKTAFRFCIECKRICVSLGVAYRNSKQTESATAMYNGLHQRRASRGKKIQFIVRHTNPKLTSTSQAVKGMGLGGKRKK